MHKRGIYIIFHRVIISLLVSMTHAILYSMTNEEKQLKQNDGKNA
jgi:hypothetical protein